MQGGWLSLLGVLKGILMQDGKLPETTVGERTFKALSKGYR